MTDCFLTPNIADILNSLSQSKVFSTLKASQASHAIPIESKSRPLTAFATAFGLYHFARMPFGLNNSKAAYCRLVQRMINMSGVEGVLAYLDDLLIHTENLETHLKLLNLVFQAHREAGIKSNAEKKHFFSDQRLNILVTSSVQRASIYYPCMFRKLLTGLLHPLEKNCPPFQVLLVTVENFYQDLRTLQQTLMRSRIKGQSHGQRK